MLLVSLQTIRVDKTKKRRKRLQNCQIAGKQRQGRAKEEGQKMIGKEEDHRIFSSIPGLQPLDIPVAPTSFLTPIMAIKMVSRLCQMSPGWDGGQQIHLKVTHLGSRFQITEHYGSQKTFKFQIENLLQPHWDAGSLETSLISQATSWEGSITHYREALEDTG